MGFDKPDWYTSVILHGWDGTDHLPILVDDKGNLLALMRGSHGLGYKTIEVDDDGAMRANLFVQDLDFLTVRPAYGQAQSKVDSKLCGATATTTLETIPGRGVILGGGVQWGHLHDDLENMELRIDVDGSKLISLSAYELFWWAINKPQMEPIYITRYKPVAPTSFRLEINMGLTFETSIAFKVVNYYASAYDAYYWIYYALVP